MKKSIGDNMIPKGWGFERGLDLVKRAGFDGIELWLGDVPWFQMTTTDTQVRDLRVVPLGNQPGQIIAWADGFPVALKRRVSAGTLIYLGSPVGPALWAGDAEAKRWLLTVAACS